MSRVWIFRLSSECISSIGGAVSRHFPPSTLKMQCPELPQNVWQMILQHVPLPERFSSCGCVSKTLRAAAAAATQSISIHLQSSGQHVTSLAVVCGTPCWAHLPCQQLKQLDLSYCSVLVAPDSSSQHPGVLQACSSSLTRLRLWQCIVLDKPDALASGVGSLVNLQSLAMRGGASKDYAGTCEKSKCLTLPGTVLQSLVQLTQLELQLTDMVNLQHLSGLSNLCELKLRLHTLRLTPNTSPGGFQLPASLKSLAVSGHGPDSVLDPMVLCDLTNLQVLYVSLATLEAPGPLGTVPGGAALLDALPALQQLQSLQLLF